MMSRVSFRTVFESAVSENGNVSFFTLGHVCSESTRGKASSQKIII